MKSCRYQCITATLRKRKEGSWGRRSSRGSVFTWVQCCPIAIDGGKTDADGEAVHAEGTPGSATGFWGGRQRADNRRVGRHRPEHDAVFPGARGCGWAGLCRRRELSWLLVIAIWTLLYDIVRGFI